MRLILVFASFYLVNLGCLAQENSLFQSNLSFKNITTKDGLSQRSIASILQDNEGFMWFGTRFGLNKYDGTRFQTYNYNSAEENSLSNNRINSLTLDKNGRVWIGTESGLNLYNSKEDNFTRIKNSSNLNRYYTKSITDIIPVDSTFLWIASTEGLDKFNTETNEFSSIENYLQGSLSSNNVTSITMGSRKDLWICTAQKIHQFNTNSKIVRTYNYPNNKSPNVSKNFTTALFKDDENNLWLGYNGGLAFFNKITKTFEDYKLGPNKAIIDPVRSICQDKMGLFWIGTYQGLYTLNLENKSISKYEHEVDNPKSLSQNSIYSVTEDDRGDLWIGTWAGGINYIDRNSNNFLTFTVGSNNKHLNYNVVSSIIEDADENLWIGTEGGGINFYDIKKQEFKYFKHNATNSKGLNTNNIKAILKGHDGKLWIGTHGEGLSLLKPNSNGEFIHFKNRQGSLNNINDSKITALAEDANHNIWIGTNKGGVNFFDVQSETFNRIDDPHQHLGPFIYTIANSVNRNYIYVGSQNGLIKVDINLKETQKVNFRNTPEDLPFTIDKVISIHEISEDNIWIGTEGDGLYNYNPITKESINYGIKEGLPNAVIYAILPDEQNNIWVSTNNGISRINTISKEIKNFDETDGLQGNEFNYGAYLKTKNGQLIFGGTSGLTIFNPDDIIENDGYIPPVQITELKVRNKPFLKNVNTEHEIELAHNQNDISFDFVALGFAHQKKYQYAYKLDGFDEDWNYIGNQKIATYTNLNPGYYEFHVKASNGLGDWSEIPQKVFINIKTPFWKTWLAYLFYILVITGLTLTIRKYMLLRIKDKRQLRQERLDKEKIEKLNLLKLQLFTNISHDFRTPLTLIIGPLKQLIDKNEGNGPLQKQLSGMYRNASTLLQLINQLLDFRKSETGKLKISVGKRNIVPFLENIKLSFEELAHVRNIAYQFESDSDNYEVWFDEIEMKKVILNILSNAFKFTQDGGRIKIAVSTQRPSSAIESFNKLQITIEDNGKGIRKEDIPHVFDRYFQLGQHHELRSGTGVGLALAKDIVLLHKGEVLAESEEGQGTRFTILLSLGNEHFSEEQLIKVDDYIETLSDTSIDYNPSVVNIGWGNEDDEIQEVIINETLPSVLHVEDNSEVRQFIKDIFKEEYNIFEAENGQQGLAIAQSKSIDLIISDVMMPKMDGLEFCHIIKSNVTTSHIPVLLLTARSSSKTQRNAYNKGADAYVTKPFDADLLKLQVKNVLSSRKHLIDKFKQNILLEPKELALESPDEVFLKKVMDIVEDNLSEPTFMASTLIEKVHMSQSVLYRKLKALTGKSISEFIRTIRLKRASQLLLKTDMGIAEIAYEVGFNDLKYFRRCFKKVFNFTPSQYRKRQLENSILNN